MATLTIQGRKVTVDDRIRDMPPDERDAAIREIAGSLGLDVAAQGDGLAMNTTAGLNEGIYGTLGAPVDLARGALNLGIRGVNAATGADLGTIPSDSLGGSEWIAEQMGAVHPVLDPANTEAATQGERVARGVGQGFGYTIAPEAALAGATRAGLVGGRAAGMAGSVLGRSENVGTVAANALVGGAAGGGAVAGAEAAPEGWEPVAAMAGGLAAGGAAALATGAPAVARAGRQMAGDFAAPMTAAGRERMAGQRILDNAADPSALRASLDEGARELVPGSRPTTFQATGDMGIGALERGAAARNPAEFMGRRSDQNAARIGAIDALQPKGAPEAVSRALRDQLKRIDDETDAVVRSATRGARSRAAALGGDGSPEAYGATMRDALQAGEDVARAQERQLWASVDPDGVLALPAAGTRQAARGATQGLARTAKPMAGEEAAIFDVAGSLEDVVPFSDLTALRSRVSTEMRNELHQNGRTPTYARLSQLRGAIEADLEGAISPSALAPDASTMPAAPATAGSVQAPASGSTVYTPAGRPVQVQYEVVDASNLTISQTPDFKPNPRYRQDLQPRDRARAASNAQISRMASELQPERLGPSASASEGAPIVGRDGMVESGNARVMAIRRAYAKKGKSAAEYRRYLESQGYDVAGMREPVLVRRRVSDLSDADRVRFAQEANASPSMAMSASERAAADAGRISDNLLDLYQGGDVAAPANRDFVREFLRSVPERGEEGAFVTGNGTLSLEGAQRVRNALLQAAYGDGPLVASLVDTGDENIRTFGRALSDMSGDVSKLRAEIKAGRVDAGADISGAITEAARIVQTARSRGVSIADLVSQQDAFSRVSPDALEVLRAAYGDSLTGRLSRERFTDLIGRAVADARMQTTDARLFGQAANASEILQGATARYGSQSSIGNPTARPGYGATGPRPGGPDVGSAGAGRTASGGRDGSILEQPALEPNFDDAALGRLRGASSATKERAQTFGVEPVKGALRRSGSDGPYRLPAGAVPGRIFNATPKSPEAIRAFRKAAGDSQALDVLQDYAASQLRKTAENADGTLDARKVQAWRRRHAEALKAFPDLDRRFADAGKAADAITEAMGRRKLALDAAQRGRLGTLLNLDDPDDVSRVIGGIFSRQDSIRQMGQIRKAIGQDREALQGLRKAVAEHIARKFVGNTEAGTSGLGTIKSDQFQTFVRGNQRALRAAGFSADEIKVMQAVADDLQRANRSVASVKLPGGSNTAQDLLQIQKGDNTPTMLSKLLVGAAAGGGALAGGPISAIIGTMGAQLATSFRRHGIETIDDLVADALLNPDRARALIANVKPRDVRRAATSLAQRYRRAALTTGAVAVQQGRPDTSADRSSSGPPPGLSLMGIPAPGGMSRRAGRSSGLADAISGMELAQ